VVFRSIPLVHNNRDGILHEAYRQAARRRLYWHRLRLMHSTLLLICCGLIGLFSLLGWLPKTSAVLTGIAGMIAIGWLWFGGKKDGR
jgi:hypothetical protein